MEPIRDYIAEQFPEVPAFMFHLPETAVPGVLVRSPMGGSRYSEGMGEDYRKSSLQVVVRHRNYPDGYALSRAIADALKLSQTQLDGMYVVHMRPDSDPVAYPISRGDAVEFLINFTVSYFDQFNK